MLHVVTLVHYWLELHQLLEFARCSSSIYSRLLQDAEQTLCSRDNAGSKSGGSSCRALYDQLPTMVQVAEPETSQSPMLFQPGPRLMPRCSVDTLRRCITSPWLPLVRELRISVSARSAVVMAQAEQEGSDDGNGDGVTQIQQQQLSTVLRSLPNVSRLHLELMVLRVEAFESLLPHLFGRPHSELNCPFPLLDAVELRLTWHFSMINNHTTVYTIGWMNCDDTRDDGEYGEVSLGVGHSPHSLCGVTPKSLSVMGHAVPILNLSNLLALSARISHSLNMAISLGSLTPPLELDGLHTQQL